MATIALPTDRALALELLLNRLLWPVPLARWKAARGVRDLIENPETRAASTDALLAALERAELESDVCTLLTILLMVGKAALPDLARVRERIQHPSILAEVMLQATYDEIGGTAWWRAHSGPVSSTFAPSSYFERHQTHHVPVVLSSNLASLERKSGLPFVRQWAYEWQQLCDRIKAEFTEYPYYFGDFGDVRDGIIGQFSPRQSEVYRSAYLRTFSIAVAEWGFEQREAGFYVSELLPSIRGLFELDPLGRPPWLKDSPELCVEDPDQFESILRAMIASQPDNDQALVSLYVPLDATVERYGALRLSAHLVTTDFSLGSEFPREPTDILLAHRSFAIDQERPDTPIETSLQAGQTGDALPVCSAIFPIPFGYWQAHLHSAGIPIPARYMLPGYARVRGERDRIAVDSDHREVAATRYWQDHWSPNYPRNEGHTRCGTWTLMERQLLESQASVLGRKIAWSARLQTWRREKDYGEFMHAERSLFFMM
ncbi:hypothetical protein K9B35_04900 [Sphingomonas sp. R647]|uniref:hypothetical protein n=1 Tax=Sphingomonas sp. R647 TaxID=2875233 RepID=UPI001CD56852|nr:hypothetical protein [Sphingomonas sp. R647]MCA1197296.1 hypothetical protein [Sphingomonas sp. R647]